MISIGSKIFLLKFMIFELVFGRSFWGSHFQLLDAIVDKLENARSSPDGESEFTVGECDTINHTTVMHMMKCTRMYVCRSRVLIKFENSST